VDGDFQVMALGGAGAWTNEVVAMEKSIKYYKRIGSGTALSKQVSKTKQKTRTRTRNTGDT
jgi:hypothetical protein